MRKHSGELQNQVLIMYSLCMPLLLAFAAYGYLHFLLCILPLQLCPDLSLFQQEKQLRFLIAFFDL